MKAVIIATARVKLPTVPRVTVPLPPTTNELYLNAKQGRVKTPRYRKWIRTTAHLFAQLEPPESYPCEFYFLLEGVVNPIRDIDNAKPLLDAARNAGVIPDDCLRYVHGFHGVYVPDEGEARVTCWFEGLS